MKYLKIKTLGVLGNIVDTKEKIKTTSNLTAENVLGELAYVCVCVWFCTLGRTHLYIFIINLEFEENRVLYCT